MDLQGKETLVCFYMTILGKKKSSNCVVLNFQLSLKERRKKTNKKQWQTLERFIFQLWLKIIKKIIIYLLEYKNLFLAYLSKKDTFFFFF